MRSMTFIAAAGLALLAGAGSASAALLSTVPQTASVPLTSTTWSTTLSFAKFDPTLGTLVDVRFQLAGSVVGDIKFESLDAASSSVTGNLSATVTLRRPDSTTVVVNIPVFSTTQALAAYDGTTDFGGASGYTALGQTGSNSTSVTSVSAVDLALFTGLGTVSLPIDAFGSSNATGAGNLLTQFATSADATVTIIYDYRTLDVPEPVSLAVLGSGLMALGLLRRRG